MTHFTTNTCTTAQMPTLAELSDMMRELKASMPPPSEQVVGLRVSGEMLEALKQQAEFVPTTVHAGSLGGLPVSETNLFGANGYAEERADGSQVVHMDGQTYRVNLPSIRSLWAFVLLLICSLASAQSAPPHPRLSPDLYPVGTRVLYHLWDTAANNWSATISDGIVEEYSPQTIATSAGPRVPKLVKLSGAWQPNPKWEDTLPPPTIGLTLLYFAGDTFLGSVDINTQTNSAKLEVRRRMATGTLWTGDDGAITDATAQSATTVVFQQWEYLTGERSGKWEMVGR